MTYLERLKRLAAQEKFTDSPDTVLTKPPKAPYVSFGSSVKGRNENISVVPVGAFVQTAKQPFITWRNENSLAARVGADDTPSITSWGWLIHYADRDSVTCYFSPMVTHAELMKSRPDAIGAEPLPDLPEIQERIEVANINDRRSAPEDYLSTFLLA